MTNKNAIIESFSIQVLDFTLTLLYAWTFLSYIFRKLREFQIEHCAEEATAFNRNEDKNRNISPHFTILLFYDIVKLSAYAKPKSFQFIAR